jgi:AcrR family transcriptional regulator
MPAAGAPVEKIRDAARSREAILDAAERAFSELGFDGASLSEIGAAAGLSRGTPSYFFGSKDELYGAVLERVFAGRQQAAVEAFAPVRAWAEGGGDLAALRRALSQATERYMRFLLERPAFVRLLVWEELAGGARLQAPRPRNTAMQEAFDALRKAGRKQGLRAFDVDDAVLLFVSLTFGVLAHRFTLMRAIGRELEDPAARRRHGKLVDEQMMRLLAG